MTALKLPAGFTIDVLVDGLDNPRQLALSPNGTLYVGSMRAGKVYAIANALTTPEAPVVVAEGLTLPNGVAYRLGDLYVGAVSKLFVFRKIDETFRERPSPELITDALPKDTHHGWRYLRFGPDAQLYIPVGAPCNICLKDDPRYASILRMNPETGETTVFASGVRNSVGLAFHPDTGELWFSNNGRDMLGDDVPPEEINRRPGSVRVRLTPQPVPEGPAPHFGYPFIHAHGLKDPEFGDQAPALAFVAPEATLTAHSAPLGILFYNHQQFPAEYKEGLFVAQHGSWNRSKKSGYKVSFLRETNDGFAVEPFITGWLQGQEDWGRPVDLLTTPDGSMLVSDDKAGVIYRVRWTG